MFSFSLYVALSSSLHSMRISRVWRRSYFRSRRLRVIGHSPIDMRFYGNPSHRNPLENEPYTTTELLHKRLSGSGGPQSRVYGYRPRHGLDILYFAVPARWRTVKVAALNPRLFWTDQIIGYWIIGYYYHKVIRKLRLPVGN